MVSEQGRVYYITTPIYYPNAEPHLGHAYTTVFADVMARYHRMIGDETFYLTGTDEHGLKLQQAAERAGEHPKDFVDRMAEIYKRYWRMLDISYDRFIRTTDDDHVRVVEHAISEMHRKGLIYKGRYSGWYCVSCEKFYNASEYLMIDGRPYCPIHRKPLEWVEEETYYFKLSEFSDFLEKVLRDYDIVYPRHFAHEVLNKLRESDLLDVSVARPKERVWWGVEVPFDRDFTVYVWFDALLNYLTGAGFLTDGERFRRYWPSAHHVIGKDILWFHTAIWFAMLKALDLPLPRKVLVHSFIINKGLKMGKSAGNVVRIEDLISRYQDSDGVRYILTRIFNLGKDVEVSTSLLDSIYNSELADNLGNLVRRVAVLIRKKSSGEVTSESLEPRLAAKAEETIRKYNELMSSYEVSRAAQAVMDLLREANAYINEVRPWEASDPERALYNLAEVIKVAASLLAPITPKTSQRLSSALGFSISNPSKVNFEGGSLYKVSEAPILFRKVRG